MMLRLSGGSRIDDTPGSATASNMDADCTSGKVCGPGSELPGRGLYARVDRTPSRFVRTSARPHFERLLSIQRAFAHCLGAGFGVRLQRALAEYAGISDCPATSNLSDAGGRHLQIGGPLQLLVIVDRTGSQRGSLRAYRCADPADRASRIRHSGGRARSLDVVLLAV